MTKSSFRISTVTRITFLLLLGLLLLTPVVDVYIIIIFIPVVGWFIWRDQDRIAMLEKRVAALESPTPVAAAPKSEEA